MRVSIVGTGYVGLVTGACLADLGHDVVCVDLDREKVTRVNRGDAPIFERGLPEILARNAGKRLRATTDLAAAVADTELTLVAVGTPFDGKSIALGAIEEVARQIGRALRGKASYHVVVVKSTVVPGTTDGRVRELIEAESGKKAGEGFGLGMNPEFLTEGEAVSDFMSPDRIVIGGIDARTHAAQESLWSSFPGVPVLRCNNATAEMIKYASNALLATLISFSNELANLGSAIGGIDTVDVSEGLRLSRYLSRALPDGERWVAPLYSFLLAGCGFGGSCLPKDVAALAAEGKKRGEPMAMLDAVLRVNASQPQRILALLEKRIPDLSGRRVAVLGLAFRPDTDDMRESPAIPIVRELKARGARVVGYDPAAAEQARRIFGEGLPLAASLEEALRGCEAAVLVTRWAEFENVPAILRRMDPAPLLVDGRRMLDPRGIASYEGIGL